MAIPSKSKLQIITASLVLLFSLQVVFAGMISGGADLEGIEFLENRAADFGTNVSGGDSSYHATFCQGQHCVNCFATVVTPLEFVDHNPKFAATYQRNMRLQINPLPRIRPPRTS